MNPHSHVPPQCAQLNERRMWMSDGALHDAFHGLTSALSQLSVGVVCEQETHAQLHPSLPSDQPYQYDGPTGVDVREAGFLFHEYITAARIPGLADSARIRWRLVSGTTCVCSYYAPHAGVDVVSRTTIWE